MSTLKNAADDLSSFLGSVNRPKVRVEQAAPMMKQPQVAQVSYEEIVRSAWDYVASQLKEDDGAETIGGAFMLAIASISKEAKLNEDKMRDQALAFLEEIVEGARRTL